MRLICPNCGAQYAIDPRIIPEAGRDVQCSACSHTWFQDPAPDMRVSPAQDRVQPPLSAPRREIDPEVMSVLKEEAARERAAREAERAGLEVQGDLDLEVPPHPAAPATPSAQDPTPVAPQRPSLAERVEARAARPSQPDMPTDDDPALRPAPRRQNSRTRSTLLPDIEEINSTLDGSDSTVALDDFGRPEPPSARIARARRGQGRRIGFAMACFAFGIATILYAKAPDIAQAVPAFGPGLDAYVERVQEGRIWLDALFRKAGGLHGLES